MNHAFSQTVSILVSVFLFFGLPFFFACERAGTAAQYYILSESIAFVDGVCDTGILTGDMYDAFCRMLPDTGELYEISLIQRKESLCVQEDGSLLIRTEEYGEDDLLSATAGGAAYYLEKGDYFGIRVQKKTAGRSFFWTDEAVVYYGGRVRYEVD